MEYNNSETSFKCKHSSNLIYLTNILLKASFVDYTHQIYYQNPKFNH